jgi:hypothetical protein
MSASDVRCASCAAPVLDEALETGAAILLLGKAYCPSCKGAAARGVSLDDLSTPGPAAFDRSPKPPPKRLPPPPKPAAAKADRADAPTLRETPDAPLARPAAEAVPGRPKAERPTRVPPPRRAAASKTPLLLAGLALAALAAAGLFFLLRPGPRPSTAGAPPPKADPAAVSTSADPETRGKEAFAAIEVLLRRGDVDLDRVLAAIDAARPACKGSSYAAKLDEVRVKVLADREKAEAARAFEPLFEELKKAVADDPEFRRYTELQPKFQKARELAGRHSPAAVSTLAALQQDYSGRYEKEAQPHYDRIQPAAEQLAQEKRYDDALKFIDSFPAHLRASGAWRGLAQLKDRVERDRKLAPKK